MPETPIFPDCNEQQARWPIVIGVGSALVGIVLLVWRNALVGDFHFDDYGSIVENRAVRSLWPLADFAKAGRPFGLYTFALNYHFSQLDPSAYRLTNLLIHVANVLLLFAGVHLTGRIMRQRFEPTTSAGFGGLLLVATIALIWGLHPLTTQAVTNIVQRYESLAAMEYLGAWVGMLLVMGGGRKIGLILVLVFSWVGLLSKEIFATAPLSPCSMASSDRSKLSESSA